LLWCWLSCRMWRHVLFVKGTRLIVNLEMREITNLTFSHLMKNIYVVPHR
jgi:hypothetical protein